MWQKLAQSSLNGTTQSVDIKEEGRSSAMDGRWLKNSLLSDLLEFFANIKSESTRFFK